MSAKIKLYRGTKDQLLDLLENQSFKTIPVVGLIKDACQLFVFKNDIEGDEVLDNFVLISGYSLKRKTLDVGEIQQGTALVVGTDHGDYCFPGVFITLLSLAKVPNKDNISFQVMLTPDVCLCETLVNPKKERTENSSD